MKKLTILFTVIIASLIQVSAFASELEQKIAFVDFQTLERDSSAFKDLKDQIEKKRTEFQAEISKQEKDLNKQNQDLSKQRAVLSEEALGKKVKEFEAKVAEFQRTTQNKTMHYDKVFSEASNEINQKIFDIVSKLAEEKGYIVVLPSSHLLYAKQELNITPEVLKRLNQQITKANVKLK
jgi:Skp family chaperone for outer membrane proteins